MTGGASWFEELAPPEANNPRKAYRYVICA